MTSKTPLLMLLAVAVLGVYVLPAVTARFAGSHTMELNRTERINALDCEKCHTYILNELANTEISTDILDVHRSVATNVDYVGSEGLLNITANTSTTEGLANVNRSACLLCHLISRNTTRGLNVTHTKITIRVCTDYRCHGAGVQAAGDVPTGAAAARVGDQPVGWATDALNVTTKLALDEDVHSKFYNPLDSPNSYYVDQEGTNYTKGFYACMACHTHLGVSFNLTRPVMMGFKMTANYPTGLTTDGNMTGFVFQNTFTNGTTAEISGQKVPASVWS